MENKEFLDNNVEKILATSSAILEKYPTHRSQELEDKLKELENALDAYIVEYGEKLIGEEFETSRLSLYENEETPVVISSTAYYMQHNLETDQDEQASSDVWRNYNREGEPDDTYSMSQNYFPSSTNVKQYIETGHIDFDSKAIEQILEEYALLLKENDLKKLESEERTISETENLIDQKENNEQSVE